MLPAVRGSGHDFELHNPCRALPNRRSETVSAGVPASDDHDVLALGGDGLFRRKFMAAALAVLLGQVVHRKVDAVGLAARDGQVARHGRAAGQAHCVE